MKCSLAAAAAAAKSLQSCPTLCDPIDGSPPGSPIPGILQARTLEWVAISFSNAWKWKVKVKSLSRARVLATPWTAAYQAPPSMGFSRQEYWSGVPLPSPNMRQQKSHWCIEQSFGLCGRGRGWDDLEECLWNMYSIIYETHLQLKFDAGYWLPGTGCTILVHWDDPEEWYMVGGWRGVRDGNTCIPVADSCWYMAKPIQYCKVKK